jgi:hypothetical protein
MCCFWRTRSSSERSLARLFAAHLPFPFACSFMHVMVAKVYLPHRGYGSPPGEVISR